MAVLSRLLPAVVSAYSLQTILAAIFVPQANEKFYDLGGALGFLSTSFVSLYYPALRAKFWEGKTSALPPLSSFAPRQLILTAALGIWSARLGSFLARRAIQSGGDTRFDELKHDPKKFSIMWIGQATWVLLVGMPVYLSHCIPPNVHPALGLRDYGAIALITGSFLFEVVADLQKSAWRREKNAKKHQEKFIQSGLWSISRHPNYVGEIGIWTGMWALSTSALQLSVFPPGTIAFAAASPLFTYLLLRYASGVPPLEKSAEEKWGQDSEWKKYKANVPVLFPWGPKD